MTKPLHILIIEDSEDDTLLLLRELRKGGYKPVSERIETPEDMKAALEKGGWDIIISDYVLPRFSGLAALNILKASGQDLPFIIVSGKIGEDIAVGAMTAGAHDYIIKGNLTRLVPAVERELREAEVRREKRQAEEALRRSHEELERKVEVRTSELNTRKIELEKLNKELTRSNRDLEQFAYIASHDLQEPLRMISNYVQLISQRYKDKLDQDADDFISFIVNGTTQMQTLLHDLLAYARVGTHSEPLGLTDLNSVLDHVTMNLKMMIDEISADVQHESLPAVYADEIQMIQIFQNLIANAIKFHGDEKPCIHISAEQRENEWVLRVTDNGIGIDPKYFSRIFHIFKRLHARDKYPGTGIGLAISKKIVERHGGRIWVESEKGKGATFYFTIPAASNKI